MEAEESMSPRALLSYRLCGGAKVLVDSLAEQFNKLRLISSRRSSCDAMSADMQTEVVLELMRKLSSFCRDSDFASDFATVGGHTILKELLNADCSSECVQESADDIVCSILTSGNTFPSRSIVATARPTACKFVETSECSRRSNNIRSVEGPIGLTDLPEFTVYLRSIPGSIHGTGQHAVGYLLWSSAVILSRLIVQNKEMLVHNKVILECGSGQGLCGIVAGRYAAAVTLSDFSEILVNNLEYNISKCQGRYQWIDNRYSAIYYSCSTNHEEARD
jgi:Lysine methyltransferase